MDPILVENRGGWSIVTLNRPDRLNAFNPDMHRALAEALDRLGSEEDCRAIVLTGAGRGFCAGQDLEAVGTDTELDQTLERFYNPLVRRIRAMPKPVIAAVNGVAAGAGANIALACDIVLAARSAKFIQAFAKIALVPDSGGTWFLPRLVGEARARALALTGEAVGADKAADWGMIWKAVDDAALPVEAEALAAHLATQPTAALALIKRAFDGSAANTLDAQLDLERDLQKVAGALPDFREGVQAFMEKRPARFTGRPS
ncbi:2-(1,2-epoxy-1,2-dihydrophenyl)acetyl-CoA isomerase PaaG [Enterovirga rhinocerotis]|uniref:Enoyl-CoA hydratase n=1 Tax=Enterovirga rhinocerotis TaxID=1339210 RepID=A0A4R7C021_9HYPH|nr:2-(1,2-epoxy-1,2-dihydrophenyl)acetyl-CoA isomerase PaaG [Enterovirga rhinocerotis]TDR89716.1 enoyl-CoA hydratase [Enterovirga rhinocerotis]